MHRYRTLVAGVMVPVAFTVVLVLLAKEGIGAWIGSWLSGTANAAPAAVVECCEWDFGRVAAGPVLRAGFPIANRGNRRLVLREKSRSCECVMFSQPEVIVPSGGRRELVVALDTGRASGSVAMELTYWTNDPRMPTIVLKALAEIIPQSTTEPKAVLRPVPASAH